jgi:hypothetical protein
MKDITISDAQPEHEADEDGPGSTGLHCKKTS